MKLPSGWIARLKSDRKNMNITVEMSELGLCKDCKHFEYDSVEKVCGIPIIVAHEICSKWGNGCKTSEDGYCFMFEPRESEATSGESYPGEFEAMEHNGRMDAIKGGTE